MIIQLANVSTQAYVKANYFSKRKFIHFIKPPRLKDKILMHELNSYFHEISDL